MPLNGLCLSSLSIWTSIRPCWQLSLKPGTVPPAGMFGDVWGRCCLTWKAYSPLVGKGQRCLMSCSDWDSPTHRELSCPEWPAVPLGNMTRLVPEPASHSFTKKPQPFCTKCFQSTWLSAPVYLPRVTHCRLLAQPVFSHMSLLIVFWTSWLCWGTVISPLSLPPSPSLSFASLEFFLLLLLAKVSSKIHIQDKAKIHVLHKLLSNPPPRNEALLSLSLPSPVCSSCMPVWITLCVREATNKTGKDFGLGNQVPQPLWPTISLSVKCVTNSVYATGLLRNVFEEAL